MVSEFLARHEIFVPASMSHTGRQSDEGWSGLGGGGAWLERNAIICSSGGCEIRAFTIQTVIAVFACREQWVWRKPSVKHNVHEADMTTDWLLIGQTTSTDVFLHGYVASSHTFHRFPGLLDDSSQPSLEHFPLLFRIFIYIL